MKIKRPLPVTILACVYIVVGLGGLGSHLTEFQPRNAFHFDAAGIGLIQLLAVVAGAFMLRGGNWARWLAVAWIAFHVIVSAFHSLREFAIHCLFFTVIAWYLFRPEAGRYFCGETKST